MFSADEGLRAGPAPLTLIRSMRAIVKDALPHR